MKFKDFLMNKITWSNFFILSNWSACKFFSINILVVPNPNFQKAVKKSSDKSRRVAFSSSHL